MPEYMNADSDACCTVLSEFQDLSMYVNEVKRDSENLALISEIENRSACHLDLLSFHEPT